jgi:lysozyme family protein
MRKSYKKPKIDYIPSEKIQGVVFDHAVNAGAGTAIKSLQNIVGSNPDGVMGKKTIAAVKEYVDKYGEDVLGKELINARAMQYSDLVNSNPEKYAQYQNGWFNRLMNLQKQYKLETA